MFRTFVLRSGATLLIYLGFPSCQIGFRPNSRLVPPYLAFWFILGPYSFNLPGSSFLSNRLPVRFIRTAKPDLAFRNSRATAYRLFRSGAVSTRISVEAFYWWLPGSGSAFRRSLPLGARRTLRVPATLVKSFLKISSAPCRRASNLVRPCPLQPRERGRCSPPAVPRPLFPACGRRGHVRPYP